MFLSLNFEQRLPLLPDWSDFENEYSGEESVEPELYLLLFRQETKCYLQSPLRQKQVKLAAQ
ncbi:hypothetical protein AN700_0223650 [Klebsiella michiganensis]|nr:hypothetical protein AB185_23695 [Klebsiella oxytoca]MBW5933494.1 hypothetical protein [Klebsiella michiganensis]ARB25223.1 hypothetical protein AM394_30330 [Klebsiella oxytoca]AUW10469.1 hypothetical protein C2U42_15050 [Klebsiella oxytoca]MBX4819798.1 hypothetical protein [Klebsiella michiganensis]